MSKPTLQLEELSYDDQYDTNIDDDDYGFIVGPDGELKSLFIPEHRPFKTPKNIQKIFKMFNLGDPGQLDDPTLH